MGGKFQISGLKPIKQIEPKGIPGKSARNALSLTVVAKGYAPELVEVLDPKLPVMVKMKPGQTIAGRVVDEDGNPLEGVSIWARNWRGTMQGIRLDTKTDADGKFVIDDVPEDEVEYDVSKRGYMMIDETPMKPGGEDYTFTLTRPLRITGSVFDAESGKRIETFSHMRGFEYDDGRAPDWQAFQQEKVRNGRYEEEFRQKGFAYRIRVAAEGYMPNESEVIRPGESDERNKTIDFKLAKADPIKGSVNGLDGKPLANAKVILGRSRINIRDGHKSVYDGENPTTSTDSNGRYEFPPEVEPFCLVVIHEKGVAMITEKEMDPKLPVSIEPWNEKNQRMQIIRRPTKGHSFDFPPRESIDWEENEKD